MTGMPAVGRFTSDYGPRVAPTAGASTFHRGIDIAPPVPGQTGRPVRAIAAGRVSARAYNSGRGNYVKVKHDDGSTTLSQHLASFTVAFGERVAEGQQLGVMGATGVAKGVHLHFETYNPGVSSASSTYATDPEPFMLARGVNLRSGAILTSNGWVIGGTVPTVPNLPTPIPPQEVDDMFEQADRQTLAAALAAATEAVATAQRAVAAATSADTRAATAIALVTQLAVAVRDGDDAVVRSLAAQIADVRDRMPRATTARYDTPVGDTYADMADRAVTLGLTYADLVAPARAAGGAVDLDAVTAAAADGARAGVAAALPRTGTFALGGAV